jgi:hypothetical protein
MTFQLSIPDAIIDRAKALAEICDLSVEELLLGRLEVLILPEDEQAELKALHSLSDDALWTIAAMQLSLSHQLDLEILEDGNAKGMITEKGREELLKVRKRRDQIVNTKIEAALILIGRGHAFEHEDFLRRRHE